MHCYVSSTGDMKACCVSDIFLGNIKNSTVNELFDSEKMVELRQKFLRNEPDNRCKNCYDKEASGNESLRLEALNKYENLIDRCIDEPKPLYFDIRFSNNCNLKCRTCWHGNSTKWFEDAKKLNRAIGDKALIKAFENEEELEKNIGPYIEQAEEFYFAGGEPLLMEEHLWVINQLTQKKNRKCLLRYNTNLTVLHQFDRDLVELWKEFDQIEILASIDGLRGKGKMIRSGIDFDVFEYNFRRLQKLENVNIKIAPTFSLLNAELLPELHQYFFEKKLIKIDDVHFNILHQPYHYNVKALPKEKKKIIQTILENHIQWIESHSGNPKDWQTAIEYMNQDDWSNRYQKTIQETQKLNEIRREGMEV